MAERIVIGDPIAILPDGDTRAMARAQASKPDPECSHDGAKVTASGAKGRRTYCRTCGADLGPARRREQK